MSPEVAAALRAELQGDEGIVLRCYDDATAKIVGPGTLVKGNVSIGCGRNLTSRGITSVEADFLLNNDIAQAEADLSPLPWILAMTPKRQMVVYSLYFNTALGSYRRFLATWPHFLAQMEAEQYAEAAQNLRTSEPWATQVGARADRLADNVLYG